MSKELCPNDFMIFSTPRGKLVGLKFQKAHSTHYVCFKQLDVDTIRFPLTTFVIKENQFRFSATSRNLSRI